MSNVAQGARELLGDGQLLIDRWTGTTPAATGGYRLIGNAKLFTITPTPEVKETIDHTSGTRQVLSRAFTRVVTEFEIEPSENSVENLALFMLGDDSQTYSQAGGTIASENLNGGVAVPALDRFYFTANRNISALVVKVGATTKATPADYILADAQSGAIYLPSGSSIVPGTDIVNTAYTAAALTGGNALQKVLGGTFPTILCSLRLIPKNIYGPLWQVDVWKAQIAPSGAKSFISDDFDSFKIKATALVHPSHTELYSMVKAA